MARPLRIEGNGFWYHVIARGDDGRVIFEDQVESQNFLKRLEATSTLFSIEVHAYALMNTHVHLFVRTPMANLGRFMQRLLTGYSVWYNHRRERRGHVFQGRYKALLVDRNAYGLEVSRYIHLNPARASSSKTLVELRRIARTYPWSSYRAYLGLCPAPSFLYRDDTLSRFGGSNKEAQGKYARFVEEGLLRNLPELLDNVRAQSVLGSDDFMDRMRRLVMTCGSLDATARRNKQRLGNMPMQSVIDAVAAQFQVDPTELSTAKRSRSEARSVLLWALHNWCGAIHSQNEMGLALGGITGQAVGKAARQVTARRKHDAKLQRALTQLEQWLSEVEPDQVKNDCS